jgi:hypothetical protein
MIGTIGTIETTGMIGTMEAFATSDVTAAIACFVSVLEMTWHVGSNAIGRETFCSGRVAGSAPGVRGQALTASRSSSA